MNINEIMGKLDNGYTYYTDVTADKLYLINPNGISTEVKVNSFMSIVGELYGKYSHKSVNKLPTVKKPSPNAEGLKYKGDSKVLEELFANDEYSNKKNVPKSAPHAEGHKLLANLFAQDKSAVIDLEPVSLLNPKYRVYSKTLGKNFNLDTRLGKATELEYFLHSNGLADRIATKRDHTSMRYSKNEAANTEYYPIVNDNNIVSSNFEAEYLKPLRRMEKLEQAIKGTSDKGVRNKLMDQRDVIRREGVTRYNEYGRVRREGVKSGAGVAGPHVTSSTRHMPLAFTADIPFNEIINDLVISNFDKKGPLEKLYGTKEYPSQYFLGLKDKNIFAEARKIANMAKKAMDPNDAYVKTYRKINDFSLGQQGSGLKVPLKQKFLENKEGLWLFNNIDTQPNTMASYVGALHEYAGVPKDKTVNIVTPSGVHKVRHSVEDPGSYYVDGLLAEAKIASQEKVITNYLEKPFWGKKQKTGEIQSKFILDQINAKKAFRPIAEQTLATLTEGMSGEEVTRYLKNTPVSKLKQVIELMDLGEGNNKDRLLKYSIDDNKPLDRVIGRKSFQYLTSQQPNTAVFNLGEKMDARKYSLEEKLKTLGMSAGSETLEAEMKRVAGKEPEITYDKYGNPVMDNKKTIKYWNAVKKTFDNVENTIDQTKGKPVKPATGDLSSLLLKENAGHLRTLDIFDNNNKTVLGLESGVTNLQGNIAKGTAKQAIGSLIQRMQKKEVSPKDVNFEAIVKLSELLSADDRKHFKEQFYALGESKKPSKKRAFKNIKEAFSNKDYTAEEFVNSLATNKGKPSKEYAKSNTFAMDPSEYFDLEHYNDSSFAGRAEMEERINVEYKRLRENRDIAKNRSAANDMVPNREEFAFQEMENRQLLELATKSVMNTGKNNAGDTGFRTYENALNVRDTLTSKMKKGKLTTADVKLLETTANDLNYTGEDNLKSKLSFINSEITSRLHNMYGDQMMGKDGVRVNLTTSLFRDLARTDKNMATSIGANRLSLVDYNTAELPNYKFLLEGRRYGTDASMTMTSTAKSKKHYTDFFDALKHTNLPENQINEIIKVLSSTMDPGKEAIKGFAVNNKSNLPRKDSKWQSPKVAGRLLPTRVKEASEFLNGNMLTDATTGTRLLDPSIDLNYFLGNLLGPMNNFDGKQFGLPKTMGIDKHAKAVKADWGIKGLDDYVENLSEPEVLSYRKNKSLASMGKEGYSEALNNAVTHESIKGLTDPIEIAKARKNHSIGLGVANISLIEQLRSTHKDYLNRLLIPISNRVNNREGTKVDINKAMTKNNAMYDDLVVFMKAIMGEGNPATLDAYNVAIKSVRKELASGLLRPGTKTALKNRDIYNSPEGTLHNILLAARRQLKVRARPVAAALQVPMYNSLDVPKFEIAQATEGSIRVANKFLGLQGINTTLADGSIKTVHPFSSAALDSSKVLPTGSDALDRLRTEMRVKDYEDALAIKEKALVQEAFYNRREVSGALTGRTKFNVPYSYPLNTNSLKRIGIPVELPVNMPISDYIANNNIEDIKWDIRSKEHSNEITKLQQKNENIKNDKQTIKANKIVAPQTNDNNWEGIEKIVVPTNRPAPTQEQKLKQKERMTKLEELNSKKQTLEERNLVKKQHRENTVNEIKDRWMSLETNNPMHSIPWETPEQIKAGLPKWLTAPMVRQIENAAVMENPSNWRYVKDHIPTTKSRFDIDEARINRTNKLNAFKEHSRQAEVAIPRFSKFIDPLQLPLEKDWYKWLFGLRLRKFALGGKIPGKGTKDEVPALLMKGEMVVDRKTTETLGIHNAEDFARFKSAARSGRLMHAADGGVASQGVEFEYHNKLVMEDFLKQLSLGVKPGDIHHNLNKVNRKELVTQAHIALGIDYTDRIKRATEAGILHRSGFNSKTMNYLVNNNTLGTLDQQGITGSKALSFHRTKFKNYSISEQAGVIDFLNEVKDFDDNFGKQAAALSKLNKQYKNKKTNTGPSLLDQASINFAGIDVDQATIRKIGNLKDASKKDLKSSIHTLPQNLKDTIGNLSADEWLGELSGLSATFEKATVTGVKNGFKSIRTELEKTSKVEKSDFPPKALAAFREIGLSEGDLKTILSNSGSFGVNAKNLPSDLVNKIASATSQQKTAALDEAIKASLTHSQGASINKMFKKISTAQAPDKLMAGIEKVEHYAELLSNTLGMDKGAFKGLTSLTRAGVVKRIKGNLQGYNFDQAKVTTADKDQVQLRKLVNAVGSLHGVIKRPEFAGMFDEAAGLESLSTKIGGAYRQRVAAQSRFSEFGSLMLQNTAFMGSYALIGGVQQVIGSAGAFLGGFSNSLKNLQAITGSSTEGLKMMTKAVKDVSVSTKFSALEITDAATILGQAGFSATDVKQSLSGIVNLATATGSKLEDATQILTSTLTIWDKPLTDSNKYANQMTAAINQSKLDIGGITGAVQYTGNIAAAANIPFEDVLTMTSLLKDAGIKRNSTLGTGQRLLYSDFQAPSKKFAKSLEAAGIDLENFSRVFSTSGILGVMKLMKKNNYGLSQASRGMELREKSIYIAALNQLSKAESFRQSITGTKAADVANKVQMEGLGNSFTNMLNSWQINLNESINSVESPLTNLAKRFTIDTNKEEEASSLNADNSLNTKFINKAQSHGILAGTIGATIAGLTNQYLPNYIKALKITSKEASLNLAKYSIEGRSFLTSGTKGFNNGLAEMSARVKEAKLLRANGLPAGSIVKGASSTLYSENVYIKGANPLKRTMPTNFIPTGPAGFNNLSPTKPFVKPNYVALENNAYQKGGTGAEYPKGYKPSTFYSNKWTTTPGGNNLSSPKPFIKSFDVTTEPGYRLGASSPLYKKVPKVLSAEGLGAIDKALLSVSNKLGFISKVPFGDIFGAGLVVHSAATAENGQAYHDAQSTGAGVKAFGIGAGLAGAVGKSIGLSGWKLFGGRLAGGGALSIVADPVLQPISDKGGELGAAAGAVQGGLHGNFAGGLVGAVVGGVAGLLAGGVGVIPGIAAGYALGSEFGTVAGATYGAIQGKKGKQEPDVGAVKALGGLALDIENFSAGVKNLSLFSMSLGATNAFALIAKEDDSTELKTAKLKQTVGVMQEFGEKIKDLEETITSFDSSFKGFNFGELLTNSDVTKNKYTAKVFEYDKEDKKVTSDKTITVTNAALAASLSTGSAYTAAINFSAETGFQKAFEELKGKDTGYFVDRVNELENAEAKKLKVEKDYINPTKAIIKNSPVMAYKNVEPIMEMLTNLATRVVEGAPSEEKKSLTTYFATQKAKLKESMTTGIVALTPSIAKTLAGIAKDRHIASGDKGNFEDTKEYKKYKESFVTLTKNFGALGSIISTVIEQREKLRLVDVAFFKKEKSLQVRATSTLAKQYTSSGQTSYNLSAELAKKLFPSIKSIGGTIAKSMGAMGDIRSRNIAGYLEKNINIGVIKDVARANRYIAGEDVSPIKTKTANITRAEKQKAAAKIDYNKEVALAEVKFKKEVIEYNKVMALRALSLSTEQPELPVLNKPAKPKTVANNKMTALDLVKEEGFLNSSPINVTASINSPTDIALGNAYNEAMDKAEILVDSVGKMTTRPTGLTEAKIYKALDKAAKAQGLQGANSIDKLKKGEVKSLTEVASPLMLKSLDLKKKVAIETLEIKMATAEQFTTTEFDFNKEQFKVQVANQKQQKQNTFDYRAQELDINYSQNMSKMARNLEYQTANLNLQFDQQVGKLQKQYEITLDKISLNFERGKKAIKIKTAQAIEDLDTRGGRQHEQIDLKFNRSLEKIALNYDRAITDMNTSIQRSEDSIYRNSGYSTDAANLSKEFAKQKLDLNYTFSLEGISLKKDRGLEDLSIQKNRGLDAIALNTSRALEDATRKKNYNIEDLNKNNSRSLTDLATKITRGTQDLNIKKERSIEDLDIGSNTNIDKVNLSYKDTVAKLGRSYQYTIEKITRGYQNTVASIERSRTDALMFFDRAMNRPQIVTLNPQNLNVIANNTNNWSLALDAHKAALTANTTAVIQNNILLKTEESVGKAAYKDAYKKVGGKVYNDDGSLNEDFSNAYNNYMDKNSEALIDAVLENALNKTFGGVGFNITDALDSPAYMANAVANPSPGVTTGGAIAGSGMTTDELVGALYGIKAGEVRVETTAEIIIGAKGEMQGTLYDLETSMIKFDISLREANINYSISLNEAAISFKIALSEAAIALANSLRDVDIGSSQAMQNIELGFQRGLEDLALANKRGIEDIGLGFQRGLEDIQINYERTLEAIALASTRSMEDLFLKIAYAEVDLMTSIARAKEDLDISYQNNLELLGLALSQNLEQIQIRLEIALDELAIKAGQREADIELARMRALEDIQTWLTNALEDLNISIANALVDIETAAQRMREALDISVTNSLIDAGINFKNSIESAKQNLANSLDMASQKYDQAVTEAGISYAQTIDKMARDYTFRMDQFDTAVKNSELTMDTKFAHTIEKLETQHAKALEAIDTQFINLESKMLLSLQQWALNVNAQISAALGKNAFDTSLLRTALQDQLDQVARQLQIDAEVIVKNILIGLNTAATDGRISQAMARVGEGIEKGLDAFVASLGKSVPKSIEELEAPIIASFNKALEGTFKEISDTTEKVQEAVTNTTDALKNATTVVDNVTTISKSIQGLSEVSDDIAEASKTIKPTATALNTASKELSKAGQAFKVNTEEAITDMSLFTAAMPNMATAIADSAHRATTIINQAINSLPTPSSTPSSTPPTTSSDGGRVGQSFGGGDSLFYKLEPGEFILRKEISRSIGYDKLEQINRNALSIDNTSSITTQSLPIAGNSSISVNMAVTANSSIDVIDSNMDRIADGVRRIFEEYV